MEQKLFSCSVENVTPIAGLVLDAFTRDQTDFTAYSPRFTSTYLTQAQTQKSVCEAIVDSAIMNAQRKAATAELESKGKEIRLLLNKAEGYIKLAGNKLDIDITDFGIANLRDKINKGNTEGVLKALPGVADNLTRNATVLQAEGMPASLPTTLTQLGNDIAQLNATQVNKLTERIHLTEENTKSLNTLWEMVTPILDAARAMYKGVNELKMKDYTISVLEKRLGTSNGTKKEDDNSASTIPKA
jgi:hypothetical protein